MNPPNEHEREDNLLRLEHAVARHLAEAHNAAAALEAVIRALCETQGWEYGRYWQADEDAGVLRFAASWHAPDSAIASHMVASQGTQFTPGSGLVGRVWQTGQPLWVSDLTRQKHVLIATLAPGLALHGACMFPVASQGRVIGVMSFVSREVREPDQRLLDTFIVIGSQVGQFLQRKQREEEVARLNAELEARVRQRTAQLEAAHAELKAFSYAIAHDLRSPLTSIDGYTRLLEACGPENAATEGRHYLQRVRAGVRQLGDLTEAMLSLAQLSSVELESEDVDLAELARKTLAQLQENEPGRAVAAHLPDSLWVRGDPRLLPRLIANLVGNAWKFSARKPEVWVQLGCEAQPGGEMAYFVADHGAGFDMAYAAQLFGAFRRLHTPSEFAGTGIGLALVQKIVTSHGGRIWAQAQPDEGATFYFTLPSAD